MNHGRNPIHKGAIFLILALILGIWPGGFWVWAERNPFSLPPGVQKGGPGEAKPGVLVPGMLPAPAESQFLLTTILISGNIKVAAINGKLVRTGETLDGYEVRLIEAKRVILTKGKEKKILYLTPLEHFFVKVPAVEIKPIK